MTITEPSLLFPSSPWNLWGLAAQEHWRENLLQPNLDAGRLYWAMP